MASARARHADRDGVGEGASAGIEGSVDGAASVSEAEGEITGGWGEQDPRASTPATAHPMVLIAARLRRRMCPILHALRVDDESCRLAVGGSPVYLGGGGAVLPRSTSSVGTSIAKG